MPCSAPARAPGFTLIECLVTLALAAVLMTLAIPSARQWQASQQVRAAGDRLFATLAAARARAAMSQREVWVCAGDPVSGCRQQAHWTHGWLVFGDRNGDGLWASGEPLFRIEPGAVYARITGNRSDGRLRFLADGSAPGSNQTLTLCHRTVATPARRVVIANTGRIRTETAALAEAVACP